MRTFDLNKTENAKGGGMTRGMDGVIGVNKWGICRIEVRERGPVGGEGGWKRGVAPGSPSMGLKHGCNPVLQSFVWRWSRELGLVVAVVGHEDGVIFAVQISHLPFI